MLKLYTKTSSLRTLKIMPRKINELYFHEFGFSSQLVTDILVRFDVWFQSERRHGSTRLPDQLMTGGCVHLLYTSSWKFHHLAAGQLLSGQQVQYRKDRLFGPSIMYKSHLPGHSLLAGQEGRHVGPAL
jgi:hypothetical protein